MNARRARQLRAAERIKVQATLNTLQDAEPVLIGTIGGQDYYKVGTALFLVPVLLDDYPPAIKTAIDRRRRASLTGRCDCGAERRVGRKNRIVLEHETDCDATDERLDELAAAHGMTLARAF
jgi:hypothetical protein